MMILLIRYAVQLCAYIKSLTRAY